MNAKFEWFGFSVARKHVFFYTGLVLATMAANTLMTPSGTESSESKAIAELNCIAEQVATLRADPTQP